MSDTDVIGFTRQGRPVFRIAGAEGEGDPAGDKPDPDPAGDKPDEPDWKAESEKWKSLARKHEGQAKANADAARRLKEMEDQDKTESQKAADRAAAADKRAEEAEMRALRLEVASDKGLTAAQAKRLVGTTKEELEADADELLQSFKPDEKSKGKPGGKPKERLKGGGDPDDEPQEMDPRRLAAAVPRGPG